jgi:hypothetical protein
MNMTSIPRREILTGIAGLGLAPIAQAVFGPLPVRGQPATSRELWAEYPTEDPAIVRETVLVAHARFDRLRELVTARPTLAKASWDWGFGDWESALGASSHMGRRDMAEFLIDHGARPTIFSAAMLGQLEVVRAFVESAPGVQRIPGPHGITLLGHARNGGEDARPVAEYLESLGDADLRPETVELSSAERAAYVGKYAFGDGPDDRFEIFENRESLRIRRGERTARSLMPLGDHAFFPSGAPAVRIRFEFEGDGSALLRVLDPDVVVTAARL